MKDYKNNFLSHQKIDEELTCGNKLKFYGDKINFIRYINFLKRKVCLVGAIAPTPTYLHSSLEVPCTILLVFHELPRSLSLSNNFIKCFLCSTTNAHKKKKKTTNGTTKKLKIFFYHVLQKWDIMITQVKVGYIFACHSTM